MISLIPSPFKIMTFQQGFKLYKEVYGFVLNY